VPCADLIIEIVHDVPVRSDHLREALVRCVYSVRLSCLLVTGLRPLTLPRPPFSRMSIIAMLWRHHARTAGVQLTQALARELDLVHTAHHLAFVAPRTGHETQHLHFNYFSLHFIVRKGVAILLEHRCTEILAFYKVNGTELFGRHLERARDYTHFRRV